MPCATAPAATAALQVRALRKRAANLPDDYLVVFAGEWVGGRHTPDTTPARTKALHLACC
jgi:hypothetical protein